MNEPQEEKSTTRRAREQAITIILITGVIFAVEAINLITPNSIQQEKPATIFVQGGGVQDERSIAERVEIPASWGDLGVRMVDAGVIDRAKFEALYASRGGLTADEKRFLDGRVDGNIIVTQENSNFILNLLWALGLGNENTILEKGQMSDSRYGGAGKFASTGGWTLATGDAMEHYSAHPFIILTTEQQTLVERVSGGIYRPCCNNPAIFPDCNHGMAMLGLLELLASQGASEEQMYKAALQMNRFWFSAQYAMIDRYLESKDFVPSEVLPKEILGKEYSSASGFARVASSVEGKLEGGGSCGV